MGKKKRRKAAAKNRNRNRKEFNEDKFLTRILIFHTLMQIFKDFYNMFK